jgi:hypothetical protein
MTFIVHKSRRSSSSKSDEAGNGQVPPGKDETPRLPHERGRRLHVVDDAVLLLGNSTIDARERDNEPLVEKGRATSVPTPVHTFDYAGEMLG